MTHMTYFIVGILLFIMSVQDIRKRAISNKYIVVLAIISAIGGFFVNQLTWMDMLGGCSMGLCLLGIAVLTREQIGTGDGLVVAALGLLLGAIQTLTMLSIASLLMAAFASLLIILKKGNKKLKLPFLPAISVGYVLCMLI